MMDFRLRLQSKETYIDIFAYIACIVFIACGILVSLHRYWQYEVSFIDFGIYDQIIWKVSQFQEPIVLHFIHGKINFLGDHVVPSIFIISPLYWLIDKPEMILIVQSLVVGLSGILLYDLAKYVLKDHALAFSILTSYFLFTGLQNAVITEFHELTVMVLPFMAALWAIVKNKKVLYYILLIITLGFKEITFSLGIGLGIALIFLKREWTRTGIFTLIISLLWGFIAFKIIIPYFSQGQYLYASSIPDGLFNKIYALVDHPLKRRTLFYSFLSFSYLSFFAPQFWLAILQDYTSRFLPQHFITRWDLGLHYNAQSAVWLSVASVFGLKRLLNFKVIKQYKNLIALFIILNSFILFRFVLHGPFLLAINPSFYNQTKKFDFLNTMVKTIPPDSFVMTHNNLATRFTHQEVALLTPEYEKSKPDYILLDLREGQSPNNFCCNGNLEIARNIYQELILDERYVLTYQTKEQFIFKRK